LIGKIDPVLYNTFLDTGSFEADRACLFDLIG